MCTVTYLPAGENRFFLTSNRDESPLRRAETWQTEKTGSGETIHFPMDPLKGGTWFAVSDLGRAACLLNGASVSFEPDPRFTTSRGTVIPDYFQANRPGQWILEATFSGIAPFTLILFDGNGLTELTWDGNEKNTRDLEIDKPRIWSSVTLYPPEVRQWRQMLFQEWMDQTTKITPEKIMQFHRNGGQGDHENALVMNRDESVKTLSITSFESAQHHAVVHHLNLDTKTRTTRRFQYQPVTRQP